VYSNQNNNRTNTNTPSQYSYQTMYNQIIGNPNFHKDFEPNKKDWKSEINALLINDEEFNYEQDIKKSTVRNNE